MCAQLFCMRPDFESREARWAIGQKWHFLAQRGLGVSRLGRSSTPWSVADGRSGEVTAFLVPCDAVSESAAQQGARGSRLLTGPSAPASAFAPLRGLRHSLCCIQAVNYSSCRLFLVCSLNSLRISTFYVLMHDVDYCTILGSYAKGRWSPYLFTNISNPLSGHLARSLS